MSKIMLKAKGFIKKRPTPYEAGSFHSGFVLLFAVTLSAILLAIGLGVANIALKEVKFGTNARDANNAFFAADIGVECALYNDKSTVDKFPSDGPATMIKCANTNIMPSFSSGVYNFVIPELDSSMHSCAKVTVDKSNPAIT